MSLIYKKTAHLYVMAVTVSKTSGFFNESPQATVCFMACFVFSLVLNWLTIHCCGVNLLVSAPRLSSMLWLAKSYLFSYPFFIFFVHFPTPLPLALPTPTHSTHNTLHLA
ncbi:hypothetical protein [Listonella phage phiHSIC]|uniref:hypothetical protein n=1 Tax=Listonella phage phiHSIC TaxID=310539 RepID=UPI00004C7421|nr:hypothetical protein LPPPVgp37 [Listonella phage phiHSIC]AAW67537.1 hypothetical protein [Listonella phage phiHSIC]